MFGKILIHCFVPLKILDVVLEVAFALFDWEREKEERKQRDKQRALDAVFKQDAKLQNQIRSKILDNAQLQQRLMNSWIENRKYNGFMYARIWARLEKEQFLDMYDGELEEMTVYKVTELEIVPTDTDHDFLLEDSGRSGGARK